MPDMPTDTLPREMTEARNKAIGAAAKALWQEGGPRDSELPNFTAGECQAFARIAVNAAWDSLGPLFDKLIARVPQDVRNRLEWAPDWDSDTPEEDPRCAICDARRSYGHLPGCWWSSAIRNP